MKTWNVCPNDLATLLDVVINSIHNIIYVFLNLIWCPPADFPGSYSLRLVKVLEWRSPVMQLKGGWTTLDRIQIISLGLHKSKKKKKMNHMSMYQYASTLFSIPITPSVVSLGIQSHCTRLVEKRYIDGKSIVE